MAWEVKWYLRSEARAITEAEKQALLAHAEQEEGRGYTKARYILGVIGGSGSVAAGMTQVPEDLAHPDWALLLSALSALRAVIPDAQLRIEDDLGLISWNDATGRYETRGWERSTAAAAAAEPAPAEDVADAPIRAALSELTTGTGDRYAQRQALAAKNEPERVARLGMALLPTLPKDDWPKTARSDLAQAIAQAMEALREIPASLEPAIRTLWLARPDSDFTRYIATALEQVAGQPFMVALAKAALESDETDADTLNCVCQVLTRARAAADEVVPLLAARAQRDRKNTGRESTWRERLLCALEFMARPNGFATVLLDADVDRKILGRAASALAKSDAARALPYLDRMKDAPGISASSLVRVLGDVAVPAAAESLIRYLDHGEAATRTATANALVQHGRLPEIAAVWRTLDAAVYRRDSYPRERALRAFDVKDNPASVDWDALVTARGNQPLPLPPLPTPLEALTHPHIDVRNAGRYFLEETAAPEHVFAIALAYELEEAVAQLSAPRGYPNFYKWRTFLGSVGCDGGRDDKTAQWIRQNLALLPAQVLTPELEAIRDGGVASAAARCVPTPFSLSAEERTALQAEEASVAAQAGVPRAAPEPIEAQDLFPGPHPEASGPAMDARSADWQVRPEPHDVAPSSLAESSLVELLPGETQLSLKHSAGVATIAFRGVLRARTRWLRLDAIEVMARDREGAPLIAFSKHVEQKLRPAGRVDFSAFPEGGKLAALRSAEAYAILRRPFQVVAQRYELPTFGSDSGDRVPLKGGSGSDLVRASVGAYLRRGSGLELDLLVEVALGVPTRTVPHCEVVLALRGARGAVLSSRQHELTLPTDGSPAVLQQILGLDGERAKARWLEVAVRGAITQRVPLCTFQVPASSSS